MGNLCRYYKALVYDVLFTVFFVFCFSANKKGRFYLGEVTSYVVHTQEEIPLGYLPCRLYPDAAGNYLTA